MTHWLHFGAAQNQLPAPWQNLNAEHDIRKRLRFEDESVSRIVAEHVIEHVSWNQGFVFLGECKRVLEPGGVLRVAFPDLSRLLAENSYDGITWNGRMLRYAGALRELPGGEPVRQVTTDVERCRAAALLLQAGWLHQCAWTWESVAGALLTHGFVDVRRAEYGRSTYGLGECDGHHKAVGREVAELETTVVEALK